MGHIVPLRQMELVVATHRWKRAQPTARCRKLEHLNQHPAHIHRTNCECPRLSSFVSPMPLPLAALALAGMVGSRFVSRVGEARQPLDPRDQRTGLTVTNDTSSWCPTPNLWNKKYADWGCPYVPSLPSPASSTASRWLAARCVCGHGRFARPSHSQSVCQPVCGSVGGCGSTTARTSPRRSTTACGWRLSPTPSRKAVRASAFTPAGRRTRAGAGARCGRWRSRWRWRRTGRG